MHSLLTNSFTWRKTTGGEANLTRAHSQTHTHKKTKPRRDGEKTIKSGIKLNECEGAQLSGRDDAVQQGLNKMPFIRSRHEKASSSWRCCLRPQLPPWLTSDSADSPSQLVWVWATYGRSAIPRPRWWKKKKKKSMWISHDTQGAEGYFIDKDFILARGRAVITLHSKCGLWLTAAYLGDEAKCVSHTHTHQCDFKTIGYWRERRPVTARRARNDKCCRPCRRVSCV